MESYKIDNYQKEKGVPFVGIETLSAEDKQVLMKEVYLLFDLFSNSENLFQTLESNLLSKDFDENFTYDAHSIFKEFNLDLHEETFIIWDQNSIDKINSYSLLENWNYIWYGVSDEAIILYQRRGARILLITHYGRVYYR